MCVLVVATGLARVASAQSELVLTPGEIEYRVIADHTLVTSPDDALVYLALQVRYVGTDVRAASMGGSRGRIVSSEADVAGVLTRTGVRDGPLGNLDFGPPTRRGMTESHRELFSGGGSPNNNADQNGGNPAAATALNPHNGAGEFRWAPGLAGFGNLLAFDNSGSGIGRSDDALDDDRLLSVGLIDDNRGDGDDTGIEPTAGITTDESRWDTVFMFMYAVTNFSPRTISFDYQNRGSTAYAGLSEETLLWWDESSGLHGNYLYSNAAAGVFRDDLSDNIQVVVPGPGVVGLMTMGALVGVRRRRG